MTQGSSYNCFICADEFSAEELHSVALSDNNIDKYKVCDKCLGLSNPDDDYQEVKNIIDSYLNFNQQKFDKPSKVSKILDKLGIKEDELKELGES
jgi:hypothetical protein